MFQWILGAVLKQETPARTPMLTARDLIRQAILNLFRSFNTHQLCRPHVSTNRIEDRDPSELSSEFEGHKNVKVKPWSFFSQASVTLKRNKLLLVYLHSWFTVIVEDCDFIADRREFRRCQARL